MKALLQQLETIVCQLAQREIMPRFNQVGFRMKTDGSLVTEADIAMQKAVVEELYKHWPEYELRGLVDVYVGCFFCCPHVGYAA